MLRTRAFQRTTGRREQSCSWSPSRLAHRGRIGTLRKTRCCLLQLQWSRPDHYYDRESSSTGKKTVSRGIKKPRLVSWYHNTTPHHVLPSLDAASAAGPQVSLCSCSTRPDGCDSSLPPGFLPRAATLHSLCPSLHHCCGGSLLQWNWTVHILQLGTVPFYSVYLWRLVFTLTTMYQFLSVSIIKPSQMVAIDPRDFRCKLCVQYGFAKFHFIYYSMFTSPDNDRESTYLTWLVCLLYTLGVII